MADDDSTDTESADDSTDRLAPDEAFGVLGSAIRLDILRTLGEADEPLAFSTLYDRIAVGDSAQFNYHLDRTVGHFVARTDEGYRLRPAGRRVIEAVLSGAVTDQPRDSRTAVDVACPYCGGAVESEWAGGGVELYCRSCEGRYGAVIRDSGESHTDEGYLGRYPFPPAGTRDRTPDESVNAAWTWGNLETLSLASGVCPRCSGAIERSVSVCGDHDDEGVCETCDGRYAVSVQFDCRNCIHTTGGEPVVALVAATPLLSLLTRHGYNPVDPDSISQLEQVHGEYEEHIESRDPLRARYTFSVEDDRITLAVDETLAVREVIRHDE